MSALDVNNVRPRERARPEIKGACPGALRPMQSGDGLIVRVRPHAGLLSLDQLIAVAEAAQRHGSGEIDLTNRANLQLRGIRSETLGDIHDALRSADLLDASPEAEAIRNIVVSPLAPHGLGDARGPRAIARELEACLATDTQLWSLPPKFGFVLDDGGELSLEDVPGDLYLRALTRPETEAPYALGVAGRAGVRWIGKVRCNDATRVLVACAKAFMRARSTTRERLRTLSDDVVSSVAEDLGLSPLQERPQTRSRTRCLGIVAGGIGLGLGAPFGRIHATTLVDLAREVKRCGAREISVSPWRALYVEFEGHDAAAACLAAARALGLLTDDGHPLSAIDACTGVAGCPCAALDTRAAATKLATLWRHLGITSAHVSGCPKGCARSTRADLVLVGGETDFGIVRKGRADDPPTAHIPPSLDGLEELPHG